eukprot:30013-Pelagococcus_subviridis.AAC.6
MGTSVENAPHRNSSASASPARARLPPRRRLRPPAPTARSPRLAGPSRRARTLRPRAPPRLDLAAPSPARARRRSDTPRSPRSTPSLASPPGDALGGRARCPSSRAGGASS